MADTHFVFGIQ
ncbi:hypothetical protein MIMGU_mgv1a0226412mg, partial [Erythranthe guttata]